MVDDDLIPSIKLDASVVGKQRCFDAWRETVRPIYDVEPLSDCAKGNERVHGWLVNNLIFTDVGFSRQSFSHHARLASSANYVSLQIYKKGGCGGAAADIPFELRPGEVYLFDFSREFCSVAENSVVAGVVIPHEAIGYDPARHPAHMRFPGNSSIGHLLTVAFFALLTQLPSLRSSEANAVAEGFCGLLRGLIGPEPSAGPKKRKLLFERRADLRSYLERHLADTDLGIEKLCRAFGVSRPSIYREFAGVGGVSHYITQRRLDRTFHQLLSTSPNRGRVQEIAGRWGFDDAGHFSKLFRRRFGISPSAALGMGRDEKTPRSQRPPAGLDLSCGYLGHWLSCI